MAPKTNCPAYPLNHKPLITGQRRPVKRASLLLTTLAALSILSACGPTVTATITVYHSLPDSTRLTRYAFVPLKDQEGGVENVTYKNAIKKELQKHHYLESDVPNASLLISFSYGINEGRDRPPTGMFDPATYTEYRRGLWVFMYENTQEKREETDELKIVYEGSVVSAGPLMPLSNIMPAMIEALFREFPGESGVTRKEYLDP
ncbi:MAG: DUF4136 domain-containing protein [Nitrospirota bacterium]